MEQMQHEQQRWIEEALPAERAKLVRLCAYLTGDPSAAEDIAQEAMIEAWRTADRITDQAASSAWLTGCARNSCKRWARRRGRTLAHELPLDGELAEAAETIELERDLERDELIDLLDRALALLPPQTREALIQHYVDELPQAEIAQRLGSSEGTVSVRIHRGKLAMRKALSAPEVQSIAGSYGISIAEAYWQETRIYCPHCGTNRMMIHLSPGNDHFEAMCPSCAGQPGFYSVPGENTVQLLDGMSSFKPVYNRYAAWVHELFSTALATGSTRCVSCGDELPLRMGVSPEAPIPKRGRPGIHYVCERCNQICDMGLSALALWLPEGRSFQKDHPRIRQLPERELDADGVPAIVTTFESLANGERYAVVSAQKTLRTLSVHRGPDA
jgi:RNA polymerase sigma-70 factor (ECF subfamily)